MQNKSEVLNIYYLNGFIFKIHWRSIDFFKSTDSLCSSPNYGIGNHGTISVLLVEQTNS